MWTVDFFSCSFHGNSAIIGGGILAIGEVTLNVNESSFLNNEGRPYSVHEFLIWNFKRTQQSYSKVKSPEMKFFLSLFFESLTGTGWGEMLHLLEYLTLESCKYYTQTGSPMEAPTEEVEDPYFEEGVVTWVELL